jgi:DNA-directed RNA polymerase subunit RPC12/RpoP
MVANVTCPTCGHTYRLLEHVPGQEAQCPACLNLFLVKAPTPSLLSRPAAPGPAVSVPASPPNRTILAQSEAMIRYNCPRCKKSLESPVSFAGQKLNCPDCTQRLQIPQPPSPPSAPPANKTILAALEPAASPASAIPSRNVSPPPAIPLLKVVEEAIPAVELASPAQRESCLECGVDVTRRSRVQTCPDCGSLFCSAACYREHHHHAHAAKPKKRSRFVECDYCGSTARPRTTTEISQGGWIVFALLLVFFFPLFWIGLLMTETKVTCDDCGRRLD